jgi:predicted ATPase
VIAAFAQDRPLFIVLDDLQWADESSLGFLQSLEQGWCETTGVLVLGTYRAEELGPGLRELLAAPGVTRIDLNQLGAAAVEQMVCDMLATRAPSSPFIDLLVRQSEGNPFFVTEYLRVAIAEEGLYRDADGQWQVTHATDAGSAGPEGPRWSSALRDLVKRQVAGLGPAGRELARMAAVLGREFEAELLGAATHLEDS